jgi:hypothetical protein
VGANSGMWLSVWWPWLLVWVGTAALVVAAAVILAVHWTRHGRQRAPGHGNYISFYLDDDSVMGVYLQQRYKPALRQEVEEKISSGKDGRVTGGLRGLNMTASRNINREVFRRYIEEAEPITVIGIILDVLEKADDIVYVDLRKGEIARNRALTKTLGDSQDSSPQHFARLSEVDTYLSVMGFFNKETDDEGTTVFLAPYGEPDVPDHGPRVRIECVTSGLRRTVPRRPFQARCLGKVQNWDRRSGELVIEPIAIFQ